MNRWSGGKLTIHNFFYKIDKNMKYSRKLKLINCKNWCKSFICVIAVFAELRGLVH